LFLQHVLLKPTPDKPHVGGGQDEVEGGRGGVQSLSEEEIGQMGVEERS